MYRLAKVLSEEGLADLLYQADAAAQTRGDLEGHDGLFTSATERKVQELLRNMRATAMLVNAQEKASHEETSSSTLQVCKSIF